jgi:hypothetical protein
MVAVMGMLLCHANANKHEAEAHEGGREQKLTHVAVRELIEGSARQAKRRVNVSA